MTLGIFIMGAIVTLMVVGALTLLFYGAVLDGRDNDTPAIADPPPATDAAAAPVARQASPAH